MDFAIEQSLTSSVKQPVYAPRWNAYIENGMTGFVDQIEANTLVDLKAAIRKYHIKENDVYGKRLSKDEL